MLAPSCVPSAPGLERAGASFDGEAFARIAVLARDRRRRRGDWTCAACCRAGRRCARWWGEGLASGKLVCGHARGLAGADLQAFAAAGIATDHEITSGEDLLARLRAGFTVELRGSHDAVLPGAVTALLTLPQLPSTLTLCTDDVFPDDLAAAGDLIDVLRRLTRHGMPVLDALQAATLNAAHHLGRRDLGLVAPGRRADLMLLSDLATLGVTHVFASGRQVARDGNMLAPIRPDPVALPPASVRIPPLSTEDFRLRAAGPRVPPAHRRHAPASPPGAKRKPTSPMAPWCCRRMPS